MTILYSINLFFLFLQNITPVFLWGRQWSLAMILTHTFRFFPCHQIPHTHSQVSGTLDLALLPLIGLFPTLISLSTVETTYISSCCNYFNYRPPAWRQPYLKLERMRKTTNAAGINGLTYLPKHGYIIFIISEPKPNIPNTHLSLALILKGVADILEVTFYQSYLAMRITYGRWTGTSLSP
jgi:hypothetical protein